MLKKSLLGRLNPCESRFSLEARPRASPSRRAVYGTPALGGPTRDDSLRSGCFGRPGAPCASSSVRRRPQLTRARRRPRTRSKRYCFCTLTFFPRIPTASHLFPEIQIRMNENDRQTVSMDSAIASRTEKTVFSFQEARRRPNAARKMWVPRTAGTTRCAGDARARHRRHGGRRCHAHGGTGRAGDSQRAGAARVPHDRDAAEQLAKRAGAYHPRGVARAVGGRAEHGVPRGGAHDARRPEAEARA